MQRFEINLHPRSEKDVDDMTYAISPMRAEISVAAENLNTLYGAYLDHCMRFGVKPGTITNYQNQIRPFFAWWQEYAATHEGTFSRIAGAEFVRWLKFDHRTRYNKRPSQNTIRTVVRRVRQYLIWLHTERYVAIDMSVWLPLPAPSKPPKTTVTIQDINAMFAACKGLARVRNMALLALLIDTGVRRIEAANARWENVTFVDDAIIEANDLPNVRGAGWIYLDVVKSYLDHDRRRVVVFGPKTGKLLFILRVMTAAEDGGIFNLTNAGVRHVLAGVARDAGVEFGAHDLRRTFATHWIRNCVAGGSESEYLLQLQLGHTPANVTERHYVALDHIDILRWHVSPMQDAKIAGL